MMIRFSTAIPATLAAIYTNSKVAYADKKTDTSSVISYISQFPSPGYMYSLDGRSGASVNIQNYANNFFKLKNIENLSKIADQGLPSSTQSTLKKEAVTDTLGIEIMIHGERFFYGANPKKPANTMLALRYLQQELEDGLLEKPADTLILTLQKTHFIFFKEILTNIQAGSFRKKSVFVTKREDFGSTFYSLLTKYRGSKKDFDVLDKLLSRVDPKNPENVFDSLTSEERAVLAKLGFLTPSRKEVPSLMQTFIKELLSMYKEGKSQGNIDYIKLAAFAHQRLVKIHPFEDGNGRVARAFMNSLLIEGGFCPVFFPNDDIYTSYVESSDKQFEIFLRTSIKTTKIAFKQMLASANMPLKSPEDELSLPLHSGYPPRS